MSDYPRFDPPIDVSNAMLKGRKLSEALSKEFQGWMSACMERRTSALLDYLKMQFDSDAERTLRKAGERLRSALRQRGMARATGPRGPELLENGCSLAIDGGLLIGRFLCLNSDLDPRWEIYTKHPRVESYMLPVIRVFPLTDGEWRFDPMHEGNSVALSCIRNRTSIDWYRSYLVWSSGNYQAEPPPAGRAKATVRKK